MVEIEYPPRFDAEVLSQEAGGAEPDSAALVIPTVTEPGKPFTAKAAVLDAAGLPSMRFDGSIRIGCGGEASAGAEIRFAAGRPAVAFARGLTLPAEGLFRLECRLDSKVFHSNPTRSVKAPRQWIFWGDPHVHTVLSDCHPDRCRSLNFCYVAARWLSGLDWVAAADHVSNGRGSPGKWKDQAAASNLFDEPDAFATLPAYEASLKGGAGGDNNLYMLRWPDAFVDEYDDGDVKTLCRKLTEKLPVEEFFAVPHHTTRTGKHGEIGADIYPGADLMPVVEIHSQWGTSEYRGNPNPLHKIHPGPSYVVDLLNAGLMLGFIGGTDTHSTMPGLAVAGPGHIDRLPGITAVKTSRLRREEIFRGVRGRDCYAASGERTLLEVSVAGSQPGRAVPWPRGDSPRRVRVDAAARGDLAAIEIVRNGQTVARTEPGDWKGRLEYTDGDDLDGLWLNSPWLGRFAYYYARVTCRSGAQAWSSPVWLRAGR